MGIHRKGEIIMKRGNTILGFILIALGGLYFYQELFNITIFSGAMILPFIVTGVGMTFELGYFIGKKAPGLLVPGGILTTIGVLFFFEVTTGWRFAGYTWPIYILSVAVGLFQLYLFYGRPKGLLIPVFILTLISGTFLTVFVLQFFNYIINISIIIPVALIATGAFLVLRRD